MLNNNYIANILYLSLIAIVIYNFRSLILYKLNVYDIPDGKLKKHPKKISSSGGLIFLFYIFLLLIFDFFQKKNLYLLIGDSEYKLFGFLFSSLSFYLIGLYDDKFNLNYKIKSVLFLIIIYVCLGFDPDLIIYKIEFSFTNKIFYFEELSKFFTILCFFIFINALNLYDGIDLQSGTYIFSYFFILGFLTNNFLFFYLLIPTILFLVLNKKNEMFMGDNGTILLGFLISYFTIKIYNSSLLLSDEIFILMMLPGIDMLRLFISRLSKGKNPFIGDRNHIHHILENKFGYNKTIIILNLIIIFSFFLIFLLEFESLYVITIVIFIYLYLVYKK